MAQPGRAKVLKRVNMGSGGYRWSYGGKLIPAAQATRIKAARSLTGTKPRSNPTRKRRRKKNPRRIATSSGTKRATTTTTLRRKAYTRRAVIAPVSNPRRKRRLSAATRRKISASLRSFHRGTKRASNPPKKRRTAVARMTHRRRTTRRRNPSTRKPRFGTKAYYRWLGKKGAAARKRRTGGTSSNPRRRRRRRSASTGRFVRSNPPRRITRRRRVRRNPATHKLVSTRYSKTRYMERRTRGGKKVPHRVKRTGWRSLKTGKHSYRYSVVKRNPGLGDIGGLIKKVLPIYGGMIAARAIGQLVNVNVVQRFMVGTDKMIKPENAAYAKPMAPGLTFLLSVLVGPAVLKGSETSRQLLEGLQLGSLVATFDSLLSAFAPATAKPYLGVSGYDDMGVLGYGRYRPMGAYMADPTGYSLPSAPATLEPGMGLDVHEAMALDSYVADDGMGLNVEEALADSESDYMQRGGAGGSLAKTVFTY